MLRLEYTGMSMYDVLAAPQRRAILDLLRAGPRHVGELVEQLQASQPTVSKQLRVLREAGLVVVRAQGQQRVYALDPRPLQELDAWLQPYRALWAGRLDALEAVLDAS